jgi:hypothetical protein
MPVVEGAFSSLPPHSILLPRKAEADQSGCRTDASFKPELMDAVYSWCNGAKFSEICKVRLLPLSLLTAYGHRTYDLLHLLLHTQMTDVFEGSLIRVFRRLQELIRQMSMGAFPFSPSLSVLSSPRKVTLMQLVSRLAQPPKPSVRRSSRRSSTTRSLASRGRLPSPSLRRWCVYPLCSSLSSVRRMLMPFLFQQYL